jgi:hypothetical protein
VLHGAAGDLRRSTVPAANFSTLLGVTQLVRVCRGRRPLMDGSALITR